MSSTAVTNMLQVAKGKNVDSDSNSDSDGGADDWD